MFEGLVPAIVSNSNQQQTMSSQGAMMNNQGTAGQGQGNFANVNNQIQGQQGLMFRSPGMLNSNTPMQSGIGAATDDDDDPGEAGCFPPDNKNVGSGANRSTKFPDCSHGSFCCVFDIPKPLVKSGRRFL
jgi:hypothetical protein